MHLWQQFYQKEWPKIEGNTWLIVERIVEILLLFAAARILMAIVARVLRRVFHMRAVKLDTRRRDTLEALFENVSRYIIYFIFLLLALQRVNFHIGALLAGAGIAGLAIGFGAQSIIKDVLTGLLILFEDQYGVGDVVQINGFTGTVTFIGLRLTRVKAWTGEVETIPNGQIQQVTNYSKYNSIAVIDVSISYTSNIDKATSIMRDVMDQLRLEMDEIVGDIQVLGIQSVTPPSVNLRVTAECAPVRQWGVQRIAQQRIKAAFEEAGIEIPFPHTVVHMGEGNWPRAAQGDAQS